MCEKIVVPCVILKTKVCKKSNSNKGSARHSYSENVNLYEIVFSFSVCFFISVQASVYSQQAVVNVEMENVSLKTIFTRTWYAGRL